VSNPPLHRACILIGRVGTTFQRLKLISTNRYHPDLGNPYKERAPWLQK